MVYKGLIAILNYAAPSFRVFLSFDAIAPAVIPLADRSFISSWVYHLSSVKDRIKENMVPGRDRASSATRKCREQIADTCITKVTKMSKSIYILPAYTEYKVPT